MTGRIRLNTNVIAVLVGIVVCIGIVLIVTIPRSSKGIPNLNKLIQLRSKNSLLFNESMETDRDVLHDKRRYVMRETCRHLNNSNSDKEHFDMDPAKFYNIYVNDEYKFLYCSVPKVACSNWKRALLSVMGVPDVAKIPNSDLYDHDGKYYETMKRMQLNMYTRDEALYRLKNYRKFMFVREPFERILSAWRNKFTVASNLYFQQRWGSYIIRKYRENPDKESLKKGNDVTYPEFVEFLLNPQTEKDNMHNDHWQPYETLCYPCIVEYDYIGKYATMDDDIKYIMDKLGVTTMKFPERSVRYHHAPTVNYVDEEYAKIPLEQIRQIYEVYKTDFAVFNYPYKSFDKVDRNPPEPPVVL